MAWFVTAAHTLALIPSVPEITLDPDLALVLFLPPLLLGSAYFTVWRDLRAIIRIVLQREDPHLVALGSFPAAWSSYIGGEALHASGVLSTVTCGIVMGICQHRVLSAKARIEARTVWRMIGFVLELLVFILISTSLPHILERLGTNTSTAWTLVPAGGAIVLAVVLSRALWIFPGVYLSRWLVPSLRRRLRSRSS